MHVAGWIPPMGEGQIIIVRIGCNDYIVASPFRCLVALFPNLTRHKDLGQVYSKAIRIFKQIVRFSNYF